MDKGYPKSGGFLLHFGKKKWYDIPDKASCFLQIQLFSKKRTVLLQEQWSNVLPV